MKYFIYSLIALSILSGCSSGKKAFEQGDYDRAVVLAANRLKQKSNHKKARNTLSKAYYFAVADHQDRISRLRPSASPLKWEQMVDEYNGINNLYQTIMDCPACRRVIKKPVFYGREVEEARQNAAEYRYQEGVEAMKFKDRRLKAVEAHRNFLRANEMVRDYKDTEELMDEALYYATLRVVVEPIPSPTRVYELNQEFFTNKINEYLHRTQISPYVRFFTPAEADRDRNGWVDHVIQMEFDRFTLGNVSSHTHVEDVSRDSVVIATRDGEKIYGTVRAKLKVSEKSISGSGLLDFKIRDINLNKVISQEKFPSNYDWRIRWATFNGDERALSDEQMEMVNRVEMNIPGPQYMFEEFAAPLYDQAIRKITGFYRNY